MTAEFDSRGEVPGPKDGGATPPGGASLGGEVPSKGIADKAPGKYISGKPIEGSVPVDQNELPKIDLEKYNPNVSFVHPVIIEATTVPENRLSLPPADDVVRNSLQQLPTEAVAPAVDALRTRINNERNRYLLEGGTVFEYTPFGKIDKYVTRLTEQAGREDLPEIDQALRATYWDSKKNHKFFFDFPRVMDSVNRGTEYLLVFHAQWNSVRSDSLRRMDEADDATVADQWTQLREKLGQERDLERILRADAKRQKANGQAASAEQAYRDTLAKNLSQRFFATQEISDLVADSRSVDPIQTAQTLWDSVLSGEEKEAILAVKKRFDTSQELVIEASQFNSYTDADYRDFMTRLRSESDDSQGEGWQDSMRGVRTPIDDLEEILIGDFDALPEQTQTQLKDKDNSFYKGSFEPKDTLKWKKANKLRGYVADVSLALLMGDIAKSEDTT